MNKELIGYLNEGIVVIDKEQNIVYCNTSVYTALGYTSDVLEGYPLTKIVDIQSVAHACKGGEEISFTICNQAGEITEGVGRVLVDKWEEALCYLLVIKSYDTKAVTVEEMQIVLENMPYAIWVADEQDHYRYTNSNTLTMVNQLSNEKQINSSEELLSQHPEEVYEGSLRKDTFKNDQLTLQKGIMINEARMSVGLEENLEYQLIKIPMEDEKNNYKGYIGISQYNILKHEVDIAKVIEGTNAQMLISKENLYNLLADSLEFSVRASRIFQGDNIVILKWDKDTARLEEISRLQKHGNPVAGQDRLNVDGNKLRELVEECGEWLVATFEERMGCSIGESLAVSRDQYIRLNVIQYNGEYIGAIFTTYACKLKYPLMDSCIIDKLCQHFAIVFKSVDYSLELRRELLKREKVEAERIAYKEALQLETLKTEFLANISHELKTPISIIYSILQMCELEFREVSSTKEFDLLAQKIARYRHIEKQNIFRLLRLINNITDISKMGAGYYQLKLENCDIVRVIEDITMSVVEFVKNKELTIIFDTEVEELEIACDPEKIERIMLNLLSNAVKYTNKGDLIEVYLSVADADFVIAVKDTGIGIPTSKQKMIFERFAQVDSSFTRMSEGSGIGLALVKRLVEVQNGSITVESIEGEGTTFTVKLPIYALDEVLETGHKPQLQPTEEEKEGQRIHLCRVEFSDIYDL